MAEDEGSGKLGHGHDSSSELTRRRVLHSSEKTKSDRPEASKSAGKEARADINNKDVYNPCWFWTYVVSFVSILTLALLLVTQTVGLDGRAEFLTMPAAVREHYSKGRAIKAEIGIEGNPIRVYIRAQGPIEGETVVLLHGLETSSFVYRNVIENLAARKLRVIAVDMPGSGLSEKSVLREWRHPEWGLLRKCRNIYDEIMEKGIFWRMEELFETGSLPEVGNVEKVEMVETVVDYSPEELSETLEQVLGSVGVSTAHLVIHGSALEVARAWALRYTMQLQSITLIDPMPVRPSMHLLLLSIPGLGWLIPRWVSLYRLVLKSCCIRFPSQSISEAYAFLLRSQNGRNAVLEIAKKSNCSADLFLWLNENKIKQIPVQVLWASNWSKEWDQRGKNFMASVPRATFISHKGSRWPQEDAADEISNAIWKFVSSLPPSLKPSQEEQLPAHIQKLFDEMSSSGDHHGHIHSHDHGHNHAHHDHGHGAQAHGIGHGGWVM